MRKINRDFRIVAQRRLLALASRIAPDITGRYLARRFVTPQSVGRTLAGSALSASSDARIEALTLDGINVCTYQWGDPSTEPYVLLAHGWSSYALRFSEWVPQLRSMGYSVIGFDQPAHGLSDGKMSHMPLFIETLKHIGRHFGKPAALIGHSLGASVTVFAQEKEWCPDRFVLIAPFVDLTENALQQFDTAGVARNAFVPFEAHLYKLTGHRFAEYDAASRLPLLESHALIIHDRHDRETPWEKGARFAKLWPGARLFTTEGLGHNRLIDHPSVINEAMNFLKPSTPL